LPEESSNESADRGFYENKDKQMPTLLKKFKLYSPIQFEKPPLSRSISTKVEDIPSFQIEMVPLPLFDEEIIPGPSQKRLKISNENLLPSMKLEKHATSSLPGWVYQTPVKRLVFNSNIKEA
jgi:hypothetical protein